MQLSCLLLQLNLSLVQNLGAYLGSPAASSPSCSGHMVTEVGTSHHWSRPHLHLLPGGLHQHGLQLGRLRLQDLPLLLLLLGLRAAGAGARLCSAGGCEGCHQRLFVMMRLLFLPSVNKNLDHLPACFNPPRHFLKQIFTTDLEVRILRVIMYCNVPTVFVL